MGAKSSVYTLVLGTTSFTILILPIKKFKYSVMSCWNPPTTFIVTSVCKFYLIKFVVPLRFSFVRKILAQHTFTHTLPQFSYVVDCD